MHFSIPETEEIKEQTGSYTLYKIFVNGAHHCSVRFSQLNNLHEQLKKEFGAVDLPLFPPKKIFALSQKEKDERKFLLEKFLQQASQLPGILNSDLFINFFLSAQKETQKEPESDVEITVFLMNFEKIVLNIKSYEQTDDLLEKVMEKIHLNPKFIFYFGIYLVRKDENDSILIVRKLQDFEYPFVSLKEANKTEKHRLLLRKSILDTKFETDLYEDTTAINLLYIQAINELEKGWIQPTNEASRQLKIHENKNSKIDFMKLISTQKFYGYLNFKQCVSDYPEKDTKVAVSCGNQNMVFKVLSNKNSDNEIPFKVTRIRCWKVSGINKNSESNAKILSQLEFSFEYLFSKNNLKWITLISEQAILISMSLQSMVDEIILKKEGKSIKRLTDKPKSNKLIPFLTRQKSLINTGANSDATDSSTTANAGYKSGIARNNNQNTLFEDDTIISNDDL